MRSFLPPPTSQHSTLRRLATAVVGVGVLVALASAPADAVRKSTRRTVKKVVVTTPTEAPTPAPVTEPPTTLAPKPLFSIGRSQVGDILVSNDGLSLYNFDPDTKKPGGSACNGPCADVWPPLTVKSDAELVAPSGFTGKLTSLKRDDGSLQAAVNGWPVYGWAFDRKPGDLNGQSNNEVWWVLDATGKPFKG